MFLLPSEAAYIPLLASHGLQPEALSLQSLFLEAAKHIPGAAKFKNVDEMVNLLAIFGTCSSFADWVLVLFGDVHRAR